MASHPDTQQPPAPAHLPLRLQRFVLTVLPVLGGLHAYIGWRLLPALPIGVSGLLTGVLVLAASTLLRRKRGDRAVNFPRQYGIHKRCGFYG